MAQREFVRKGLAAFGFICCCLAVVLIITAFASPYWVDSDKHEPGFEHMGLWEACFRNYYPAIRPITTRRYDGCWGALSSELKDIYHHFYPAWMRGVQAMMTLAMIQEVVSVVLGIMYCIGCCSVTRQHFIVLLSSILNFLSAFWCLISNIMFGVQVNYDPQWLPRPDTNYLSWAYGFAVFATILCLFSGMCSLANYYFLSTQSVADRAYRRGNTHAPELEYTDAGPPPKYRY